MRNGLLCLVECTSVLREAVIADTDVDGFAALSWCAAEGRVRARR
jgi:hypothetical protein